MARARNERRKGAEKWHEARNDDGKAAVFREEVIELRHALGRKRLDLAGVDDALAEKASNPIIRRVAQDGRDIKHDERRPDIQTAAIGGKHARREQERVARQKREKYQARFNKHNEEQRRVYPHRAKRDNPARNGAAGIGKKVQEEFDNVHSCLSPATIRRKLYKVGVKSHSGVTSILQKRSLSAPLRTNALDRRGRSPEAPYGCFVPDLTRFGT